VFDAKGISMDQGWGNQVLITSELLSKKELLNIDQTLSLV